jgi:CRP-like cAMP-binding protein
MPTPVSNRFLQSLSHKTRTDLLSRSRLVDLRVGQVLSEAGRIPEYSYVMLSGLASEILQIEDKELVEIALVGYEGLTGCYHLLGPTSSPSHSYIHMEGSAYEIPFLHVKQFFEISEDVRTGIHKYIQHQMAQLAQTAACNRVHHTAPRFARWLLTVQDRTREDEFMLTQEFLAQMLGTGRPTLSTIAKSFEQAGLVGHRRGRIRIISRSGLKQMACACYETTRQIFVKLYA